MNSPSNANLKSVANCLAEYRGKHVFFDPLHGNNGDALIEMGSHIALQTAGVELVRKPQEAKLIVINGGAAMTDIWYHGLNTLKKYNSIFPEIPLLILPSSFSFKQTDFASLFTERKSPAFLFARENYSLEILKDIAFSKNVNFGIDHDTAFQLRDSIYLKKLNFYTAQKHILVVERNDPESITDIYKPQTKPSLKNYIPRPAKRVINRHLLWPLRRAAIYKNVPELGQDTVFVKSCHEQVLGDYPDLYPLPLCAADISDPAICSFKYFSRLIAESAVVASTRLHVGILAAILGKPTYVKSGSYHKIRGIYEYSMQDMPNVKLMP